MFGLKIDYRELIYELIDLLICKKGTKVFLIPHVYGSSGNLESDSIVCQKIYDELKSKYEKSLFFVNGSYNQNEIKYIIGLSDFFIGSRMHACIAALSQHIPTVSIAYSKKFYGVMETIGVESLVADPRKIGKEEILNIINTTFDKRELVRKKLEQKIPEVHDKVLRLFREIDLSPEITN